MLVRHRVASITLLAATAAAFGMQPPAASEGAAGLRELTARLESSDVSVRLDAVEDLAEYGPFAAPAVPALQKLLDDRDLVVRHEAALALGRIGPEAAPAVPGLIELLDAEPVILKHGAFEALQGIGPAANAAAPALTKLFASSDEYVRTAAARALLAVEPKAEAAVRKRVIGLFSAGLRSDLPGVAETSSEGLVAIGEEAAPSVIEVLRDGSPAAVVVAADTLARIAPAKVSALPELARLARSTNEPIRSAAVAGIGEVPTDAARAIPVLTDAFGDESATVRAAAADAAGRFGPAGGAGARRRARRAVFETSRALDWNGSVRRLRAPLPPWRLY